MKSRKTTVVTAFKASIPVLFGYVVLGFGFGVLVASHGWKWWWATLMSIFIYAGSMEFVTVDLIAGGASLISTAVMALMVNLRHIFYSITMLEPYKDSGRVKPWLVFLLTDETFSLVVSPELPEGTDRKKYYFWVSLLDYLYWISGSTIGAIFGNLVSFNSTGIDFSMTALFVIIFVEQWEKATDHLPAIIGVGISVVCRLLFGPDRFLIPTIIFITAALILLRKKLDGSKKEDSEK